MGLSLYARLAALLIAITVLAGIGWKLHHSGLVAGRAEVQSKWDNERAELTRKALAEQQANARETLRRLEIQGRNQDAQNHELAVARADADRNRADAERMRQQATDAAHQWRDAIGHSAACPDGAAAAAAIGVLSDVRGRMDEAAGQLAEYADTARAAGKLCEMNYDSLTNKP